jgi:hypothetical protein
MTSPISPNGYLAEQLVGINTKITDLQAQRVTYVAGEVSGLDIANSTFSADIDQPDGTSVTVAGIRSSPQFLPAVNNVVTLALSGAQVIYLPFGVAAGSIDNPQLSPTVTGSISNAVSTANSASSTAGSAQTTANNAQTAANNAQTTANTKIVTFYAGVAPTSGMNAGDLWINTGSNNTLYRYSGSSWVQIQDQQIQSALVAAGTAQATATARSRPSTRRRRPPPAWASATYGSTPTTATRTTATAAPPGCWCRTSRSPPRWPPRTVRRPPPTPRCWCSPRDHADRAARSGTSGSTPATATRCRSGARRRRSPGSTTR